HRQHLLDLAAAAKEDTKRLIEQDRMFVPFHEHRMQGPVKILTGADTGVLYGLQGIEHRARTDRNAGGAQRASKVEDVFGEPAAAVIFYPLGREVAGRSASGRGQRIGHISLSHSFCATEAFTSNLTARSRVPHAGQDEQALPFSRAVLDWRPKFARIRARRWRGSASSARRSESR